MYKSTPLDEWKRRRARFLQLLGYAVTHGEISTDAYALIMRLDGLAFDLEHMNTLTTQDALTVAMSRLLAQDIPDKDAWTQARAALALAQEEA